MTGVKKHNDRQLMAIRARSLTGFQARLEIAILTYNLAYCLERFN